MKTLEEVREYVESRIQESEDRLRRAYDDVRIKRGEHLLLECFRGGRVVRRLHLCPDRERRTRPRPATSLREHLRSGGMAGWQKRMDAHDPQAWILELEPAKLASALYGRVVPFRGRWDAEEFDLLFEGMFLTVP